VKIRSATLKDLVSIQKMEGRIFNNPWSNKSIRNELKRDRNSLNLVAEIDKKIIGYFFAHLLENEVHILNIAIDVTYQHQGYGKQFFNKILENYLKIRKELIKYSSNLLKKKEIIVFNKIDIINNNEIKEKISTFKKKIKKNIYKIFLNCFGKFFFK